MLFLSHLDLFNISDPGLKPAVQKPNEKIFILLCLSRFFPAFLRVLMLGIFFFTYR